MNNTTKIMATASVAAFAAQFAWAVPVVSNVNMSQSSAKRVGITYSLSEAAVVTLEIQTNANTSASADDSGWTSIGGPAICNAQGDVWKKVEAGSRTITWNPRQTWPDHIIADGGARAKVTAWALDNPPDYMVVDISAGAKPNTQKYYPSVDFLPGGILGNPDYRESSLVMRKVPAAGVEWMMGSIAESGRTATKEASHKAMIADNYYLGVFPVTQSQWALIQTTRQFPSCFQYEADKKWRPVENICYNEIRLSDATTADNSAYYWPNAPHGGSFLGRLRTKTGVAFDMPSEAQWEYACRAGNGEGKWGDGSDYTSSSTDANLTRLACYGRADIQKQVSEGNTTWSAADGGTKPVGTHEHNAWGFYDMHGNIFEVCLDWFENDISAHGGAVNINPDAPAKNLSGGNGTYRIWRGGSYRHSAASCRSAYRTEGIANGRYNIAGLRLACPASAE